MDCPEYHRHRKIDGRAVPEILFSRPAKTFARIKAGERGLCVSPWLCKTFPQTMHLSIFMKRPSQRKDARFLQIPPMRGPTGGEFFGRRVSGSVAEPVDSFLVLRRRMDGGAHVAENRDVALGWLRGKLRWPDKGQDVANPPRKGCFRRTMPMIGEGWREARKIEENRVAARRACNRAEAECRSFTISTPTGARSASAKKSYQGGRASKLPHRRPPSVGVQLPRDYGRKSIPPTGVGGPRRISVSEEDRRWPLGISRVYHPMIMFDSMTLRARSKSAPVSCM